MQRAAPCWKLLLLTVTANEVHERAGSLCFWNSLKHFSRAWWNYRNAKDFEWLEHASYHMEKLPRRKWKQSRQKHEKKIHNHMMGNHERNEKSDRRSLWEICQCFFLLLSTSLIYVSLSQHPSSIITSALTIHPLGLQSFESFTVFMHALHDSIFRVKPFHSSSDAR